MTVLFAFAAAQALAAAATPPAADTALKDFLGLNMVIGACELHVSPYMLRDVDDYAAAAGPKVQAMVAEYRYAGRNELHFTRRDCSVMLPKAVAKARLP